jgi:hypothetical protein
MMIKLIAFFFTFLFLLIPAFSSPTDLCDGTKQHPCIVQDTLNDTQDVKHLRDMQMLAAAYKGNVSGLADLWVSGSGATSDKGWQAIVLHIGRASNGKVKKTLNLDLRQESHGFLNGHSINLTSENNWINRGKAIEQVLQEEQQWIHHLSTQTYIQNILTSDQFKSGHLAQGINIIIDSIFDEESMTKKHGFDYVRLNVTDHMAPRHQDVDRFVGLVDRMEKNTWLHIHCRAGNGRTTTFMAMYDMLKNADKASFDDIIRRQASVLPFYNLYDVDRDNPDLTKYYKKRLAFLRLFYQFADAHLKGYTGSWSAWAASHTDTSVME